MTAFDRAAVPAPAPIRAFTLPTPSIHRFDNGLDLYSAERHGLPVATVEVVVDAGAATEPADKAGLAHLTAQALDTGTRTRTGDELAWAFERLGIELEAWATWDAAGFRATGPRDRLEAALELLVELLLEPAFPQSEFDRLREEQIAELRHRAKEPRSLANDLAGRFIFGERATYGRNPLGSVASLSGLDREDVATFHRARFTPPGTAVVVTGDVDATTARQMVGHHLASWSGNPAPATSITPASDSRMTRVHLVDRPAAVQSELRIGHVGIARSDTDYFAIRVMNTLLGGAFTSRLNLSLRERHGFTYGVRSGFGFRRAPGPFIVQTAVATDVTAAAVAEILKELRTLRDDGAADDEVDAARDYLAGVLPLELQTTAQLADRLADLPIFGLSADDFASFAERVRAVSRDDVCRVARQHLHPDRLAIVVVGDATAVHEPLAELGVGPVEMDQAAP